MSVLETTICLGIGDNIVVRMYMDMIKHNYSCIRISHDKHVLRDFRGNDPKWINFLDNIGNLLFSEPPYQFTHTQYGPVQTHHMIVNLGVKIKKPNIDHLLCHGTPLNIGEEYIIITTKIRALPKMFLYTIMHKFWRTLKKLSTKYKIVIMGEREVEKSKEYAPFSNTIFGIYEQIICNVPPDRVVDLTVPALGVSVPDLGKIQQDCLIMKNAKFVISFGIGGNLWMASAVANVIGFRNDNDDTTDVIANPEFTSLYLTKNWDDFIHKLESQL